MDFLVTESKRRSAEFMAHVSPEVLERVENGKPLTWAEYSEMRINSYEQKLLIRLFDDDALCHYTALCMSNASYQHRFLDTLYIPANYNEALLYELLPEFLSRLNAQRFAKKYEQNDEFEGTVA